MNLSARTLSRGCVPCLSSMRIRTNKELLALILGLISWISISGCATTSGNSNPNKGQLGSLTGAVNFGNVTVGTTGTQAVTLNNTGTASLTITQVTVTGAGFSESGLTAPATLGAGQSLSFNVKYAPTAPGTAAGTLSIVSDGGSLNLPLSATAVPAGPQISVNPSPVAFGNVNVGANASQTVTISNAGSADLIISSTAISGTGFTKGALSATTIAPNTTATFSVTFAPAAPGAANGSVTLTHNATGSPTVISLTGTGVAPAISVSPSPVAFGSVNVGASPSQTVTVSNPGTANLVIPNAVISGAGFTMGALSASTIPPNASAAFTLTFAPTAVGPANGSVTLTSNALGAPTTVVNLSGTGVGAAAINVSPSSVPFGNVNVGGTSPAQTITVSNPGTANLVISNVAFSGAPFTMTPLTLTTIPPNSSATLTVQFAPTAAGPASGSVTLNHNASGSPTIIPLTGTGVPVAPVINVSPTNITFGSINVGSASTPQTVTISNTGNSNLVISSSPISGAGFTMGALSATTIIPNASATFSVTFAPAATGAASGSVTLNHNASGSPTVIPLSGTGVAPAISVSPSSVAFGSVNVGSTSPAQTITVSNPGTAPLIISNVSISGPPFTMTSLTLTTIPPNGSATLTVQFAPTAPGPANGSVTLTSNALGAPTTVVNLSGTGVAVVPIIGVSPTNIPFGDVTVGNTGSQQVQISNTGNGDLTITQVIVTPGQGFSISGLTPPLTIHPNSSSTFTVQFAPASPGQVSGNVTLTTNTQPSTTQIPLTGNGVAAVPGLSATPSTVGFGSVQVGSNSAAQTITLKNTGNANVTVNSFTPPGNGFTVTGLATPFTLTPGQTSTFSVQFAPTAMGLVNGSISIASTAPTSPTVVSLSGTGIAAAISVSPSPVAFGSVNVGASPSQTVTVSNLGTANLVISNAVIAGTGFTMGALSATTIAPNGSATFSVTFAPAATGSANGSVTLTSNALGAPTTVINLSGTGVAPAISVSPSSVAFGNVNVGASPSQTVTVSNPGTANLVISNAVITGPGFTMGALSATIAPNASATFSVTFAPTTAGAASGSVTLTSNALGAPTTVINLSGTGIAPNISVSPTTLPFGNVIVGGSSSMTLAVQNTGSANLLVTAANFSGSNFFSLASPTLPVTLTPNQMMNFSVQFAPNAPGGANGSLAIVSNALTQAPAVTLTGNGVATAPKISVSPTNLPFGTINVGSTKTLTLTVSNTGNATLNVTQANFTGSGFFSPVGLSLPLTIPPTQSSNITVQFAPTSAGGVNGNLALVSNDPNTPTTNVPLSGTGQSVSTVSHRLYITLDGQLQIYDMDNGNTLLKTVSLPGESSPLGMAASAATSSLYISYGGFGGSNGNGSMLKYDLMTDKVVWTVSFSHGVDSMAITPDGKTIYMPAGELANEKFWYVLDAADGHQITTITGPTSPHNTIMGLDGSKVYLGGRDENFLYVANTATNTVIRKIGPLVATGIVSGNGVRPFAVNGKQTLSFTTASGFLGFQVGDINTGTVLYTVTPTGFSWDGTGPSTPCHGISVSPDEREVYLIDTVNLRAHVFDITGLPGTAPVYVTSIPTTGQFGSIGWLQHSRDGSVVQISDTGDIIDTATRKPIPNLPASGALKSSRWYIEVDWSGGVPVFGALSRGGQGYVTQ